MNAMPATQALSAGVPNYLESWIFRRRWLRQLKAAARVQTETTVVAKVEVAVIEPAAIVEPPTPREAAKLLAEMAGYFTTELDRTSRESSNLHRRKLTALTTSFHLALASAEGALASYSEGGEITPELRESAARIAVLLDELQTNIPVWHLARGLQLFAGDCQRLARTAAQG
jgi:hypothetical protein